MRTPTSKKPHSRQTSPSTAAKATAQEPTAEEQRRAFKHSLVRWRVTLRDSAYFLELAMRNINALIQEVQFVETMLMSGSTTAATNKTQRRGRAGPGSKK